MDKYLFSIPLEVEVLTDGQLSKEVLDLFKKKKRSLSNDLEIADLNDEESVIKDLKNKREYKIVEGEDKYKVFICQNEKCKPSRLKNTNLEEKKFLGWITDKMKGSPIPLKKRRKIKMSMLNEFRKSNAKSAKEYEKRMKADLDKKTAERFKEYLKLLSE